MQMAVETGKRKKVKQLAFLSREGYLLTKLFRYYCQIVKEKDAPEIVYLETSRRAVLAASIWDKEDIYEVAQFPYIGNIGDFCGIGMAYPLMIKNCAQSF